MTEQKRLVLRLPPKPKPPEPPLPTPEAFKRLPCLGKVYRRPIGPENRKRGRGGIGQLSNSEWWEVRERMRRLYDLKLFDLEIVRRLREDYPTICDRTVARWRESEGLPRHYAPEARLYGCQPDPSPDPEKLLRRAESERRRARKAAEKKAQEERGPRMVWDDPSWALDD